MVIFSIAIGELISNVSLLNKPWGIAILHAVVIQRNSNGIGINPSSIDERNSNGTGIHPSSIDEGLIPMPLLFLCITTACKIACIKVKIVNEDFSVTLARSDENFSV